jgi:hypothetical protein
MEKYGFIYIWKDSKQSTQKKNGSLWYIGSHWGTEDDGYICSSKVMRDAYSRRPQDFKRKIVTIVKEQKNLYDEEQRWLDMIPREQFGKKYYNKSMKADWFKTSPEERSQKQSEKWQDPEYRETQIASFYHNKPEAKEVYAKAAKKRVTNPDYQRAMKERPNNHNKGKFWITNGSQNRFGFFENIPKGWIKGTTSHPNQSSCKGRSWSLVNGKRVYK